MNTKEIIKKAVKDLGYKLNREVSIKTINMLYDTAYDVIFRTEVSKEQIAEMQKALKNVSSVDFCEKTGEVLAGGNTYVNVGVAEVGGVRFYPILY